MPEGVSKIMCETLFPKHLLAFKYVLVIFYYPKLYFKKLLRNSYLYAFIPINEQIQKMHKNNLLLFVS